MTTPLVAPAPGPDAEPEPAHGREPFPAAVTAYAGAVGSAGALTALALLLLDPFGDDLRHHALELGALAAAVLLGELKAMAVPRGDGTTETVGISTVFAVALVLVGPLSFAVLASLLASALHESRRRRPLLKVLFNGGQQALSLTVARLAYCAVSGTPVLGGFTPFTSSDLLAALAAGVAYSVLNGAMVAVVVALASGEPVLAALLYGQRFMLETSGLLAGLAPVVALLVQDSALLLPLLLLPILAVGRAALLAVEREKQSLHDPLTGLANRALLRLRLERALRSASGPGIAVLMLDLDHFKDVNDTLGHSVGDELLCAVAARLTEATARFGTHAEVARLGGDEFAVLLVVASPQDRAVELADRLLHRFCQPVEVQGTRLAVQMSIGITTTDGAPLQDVDGALKQADTALYEAKRERARASLFSPGTMAVSSERVRLLPELQEAVETGQLTVLYQPQVQAGTGRVVAVEALVRWDHPARGRLAPSAFLDLAESAGLIPPITTLVVEGALAAVAGWRERGWDVGVSVNLSARQLSDLALPEHVASLLRAAGVPASVLTVEVTESSLMADPRAARTILSALRDMGVQLSIDDFGTGYSSLVLLQQLDVDELKVDRSFVAGMASGGHDEILVRSVIELAHNLGLSVVAEGVETADVAAQLTGLGCDRLQGYLFGRPMAADAVDELLAAEPPPLQPFRPERRSWAGRRGAARR